MVEGGRGVPEKEYIGQFIQYFDDLIYFFSFIGEDGIPQWPRASRGQGQALVILHRFSG